MDSIQTELVWIDHLSGKTTFSGSVCMYVVGRSRCMHQYFMNDGGHRRPLPLVTYLWHCKNCATYLPFIHSGVVVLGKMCVRACVWHFVFWRCVVAFVGWWVVRTTPHSLTWQMSIKIKLLLSSNQSAVWIWLTGQCGSQPHPLGR